MPTPPTLPLTYPDIRCTDDMDPFATETASDLETLEQDVLHILLEDPGSNLDDPTRGIGVLSFLSGDQTTLAKLPSQIDHQLRNDDRIDSSITTVTQRPDGSFLLEIEIAVSGQTLGLVFST